MPVLFGCSTLQKSGVTGTVFLEARRYFRAVNFTDQHFFFVEALEAGQRDTRR